MKLSDQERLNLIQATDLFEKFVREFQKGAADLHAPHAIIEFVHNIWHDFVEPDIEDELVKAATKPGISVPDLNQVTERGLCGAMEMTFVLGYLFREKGYRLAMCQCGELSDKEIEELLRGHKH